MRYQLLATDYDGTLATDSKVTAETVAALKDLLATGRRLVLVTGRELDDLMTVYPDLTIFERVVAENGALLYRPATKERRRLAEPPPAALLAALRRRGVAPLSSGEVIVATRETKAGNEALLRLIELPLAVSFQQRSPLVGEDRFVELDLSALQPAHDLLQLGERLLETHRRDISGNFQFDHLDSF